MLAAPRVIAALPATLRVQCEPWTPLPTPPELATLVEGATWEQVTLSESGAQVYWLRSDAETRYLKIEPRRPPRRAARRGRTPPLASWPPPPGSSQALAATERLQSASVSAEAARAAQLFLDGLKPPPPTGGEMRAIFDWQHIYHPDMTDEELAEAVHFSPHTIRNERSRLKYGKRMTRESISFDEFARRHMNQEQRDAYGC